MDWVATNVAPFQFDAIDFRSNLAMPHQDPHSFADTSQGRIQHIDFDFQVSFEQRTLSGRGRYSLKDVRPGSLFLDTRGLRITDISSKGKTMEWAIDQEDRVKGERLHIKNPVGASEIDIAFETSPKASALGWLEPQQTEGGEHPFLLSQCQAIHARSMFPCQDSPSVRFTYNAKVRVPAPLTAAMSADRVSVDTGETYNTCHFAMPQAIPSYLFALAVGNLAFRSIGPRCGVFAEPEMVESAAWEFADTERFIDEAEKLFGPYLWETFNMLILPPSFPYGGMENPRLAFLTPTLIVGDRSMVHVVAHELAHSWTGNLVTNATWEDFWLNEGWTVYAERRLLAAIEGEPFSQLQAAVRRKTMLEDIKVFGVDSDATKLNFSQEGIDPDDVFSTVPYEKGSSFLCMVEDAVGRERFDGFIRKYINQFQFQSLSTGDFLAFMRQEFPEVDDKVNVKKWVFEAGFPEEALEPSTDLLDSVFAKLTMYEQGQLPNEEDVAGWIPAQVEVFLKGLPRVIPSGHCAYFGGLFGIEKSRNRNHQTEFLVVAIRSGYEPALDGVQELVSSVGRMLYLKPLYRALAETDWVRGRARGLFEKYRDQYHPIASAAIDRLLTTAGL